MKRLLLAALLVGAMSPAWGLDGDSYTTVDDIDCSKFLDEYAKGGIGKDSDGVTQGYGPFKAIAAWIAGYMTSVNRHVAGKTHYFRDFREEVIWIASWCRDNPSESLSEAMSYLSFVRGAFELEIEDDPLPD